MSGIKQIMKRSSRGFTVIELLIATALIATVGMTLFEILWNMTIGNDADRARATLTYQKEAALNLIEPDVRLTEAFLAAPSSNMVDNNAPVPSGGWYYAGSSNIARTLILEEYSTDINPLDSNREPVYEGATGSAACQPSQYGSDPVMTYNTVYYLNGTTLYRRRLVDATGIAHCNNQYQQQSCAPFAPVAGCPNDEKIADNVTNFSIDYYADSTSPALDAYGTGGSELLASARFVVINLTLSETVANQPVVTSSSFKVAKLN